MAPAKRKATDTPAPRRSTCLSNKKAKMTTQKCDAEIEIKHQSQVAASPQRKATTTSATTRSSARLSNKRTSELDAEIEIKHEREAARTWAPRVEVPHDCKEKLDEVTRLLDFKTVGSTVNFLLPTIEGAKEIAELSRELGHDTGGQTINWLLQEAEPFIAAIVRRQDASTIVEGDNSATPPPSVIAGYNSATPPMHAPPFRTPQFSQNPQGVISSTFISSTGNELYSSIPYPPAFTPTSTAHVTINRSDHLRFQSTYFDRTLDQSQIEGYGQFDRLYNPIRTNMQGFGFQPLQSQGKSQQEIAESIPFHKSLGRNIVGPEKGVSTQMQYGHGASVDYGDSKIRMDQLQAPPQVNHLIPRGSNSLNELGRTCEAQTQTPAMQLPVENGDAASNNAYRMTSWIPNPNPAQNSIMQMQAPADQKFEPEMEEGMKNNWQKRNLQGYRDQRSMEEMNLSMIIKAMPQVDMPGSSVKDPVSVESDDD